MTKREIKLKIKTLKYEAKKLNNVKKAGVWNDDESMLKAWRQVEVKRLKKQLKEGKYE